MRVCRPCQGIIVPSVQKNIPCVQTFITAARRYEIIFAGENYMLRIAAVDDEAEMTLLLKNYIERYAAERGRQFVVETYSGGFELLGESKFPDIIFLDIEMPNLSGMETARAIRERDAACVIIFITNIARYAIEGYSVNALDYILKPVNYRSFAFKMRRAEEVAEKMQKNTITVTVKYGKQRIAVSDIYYVEVVRHKLTYHTADGDVEVWDSMKNAQAQLSSYGFALCNVCYLVNLRQVKAVVENEVAVGKYRLKISRQKKNDFLDALTGYMD